MKIVIDIPEEKYKHIQEEQWLPNRLLIEKAIANGTPLNEVLDKKMIEDLLISDSFDPVEFVKNNYRPVENKSNYVWLDRRRCQMISITNLAASIEDWYKRLLKEYGETKRSEE